MNTNKIISKILLILIAALVLAAPFVVYVASAAEGYKITTSLPGTDIIKGQTAKGITLQQYVRQLYLFSLGIVGLVALAAITYQSVRYIMAAGNASKMSDAMGGVQDAVLGLVLLLLAATILVFINPNLVNLRSFDDYLQPISGPQVLPCNVGGPCTTFSSCPGTATACNADGSYNCADNPNDNCPATNTGLYYCRANTVDCDNLLVGPYNTSASCTSVCNSALIESQPCSGPGDRILSGPTCAQAPAP
ncbi:MAG: hypothetical protein HYT12_01615 [Candidatus Liptonbacteria bacterium]|nr:hypothetical protein [Candidatus Liptonbacteria bacterium]